MSKVEKAKNNPNEFGMNLEKERKEGEEKCYRKTRVGKEN
jgi:hypothetical protein